MCGSSYKDYSYPVDVNFTHTSSNISIQITNNLYGNVYSSSYGIKDLFLLIDYVKFTY